jgi:arsenate reductase-like glutaredoxin family protein
LAEYTREPLTEGEIPEILRLLGIPVSELLRTQDLAYAELGLAGEGPDDELTRAMARHTPPWSQRPIGRLPGKTVLGCPPERLLRAGREVSGHLPSSWDACSRDSHCVETINLHRIAPCE